MVIDGCYTPLSTDIRPFFYCGYFVLWLVTKEKKVFKISFFLGFNKKLFAQLTNEQAFKTTCQKEVTSEL